MNRLKQLLSVTLSLALLWSSGGIAQAAEAAPGAFAVVNLPPQFNLVPPGSLGRIADYYTSPTPNSKLVILIQDLHAHYGVQKNIAGILDFLTTKLSKVHQDNIPFALAVEGAQGPVDSSVMALFPDQKIKQSAADYLMREGELTGAEYFAVMRGIPDLLTGVENGEYYNLNRELFRKTLSDRQELVELLKGLQGDIKPLEDSLYGPSLKVFQKTQQSYDDGKISREELLSYLIGQGNALHVNWKKDFPELARYAMAAGQGNQENEGLPTQEQLRSQIADFLQQTQNVFTDEDRQVLTSLAKKSNSTEYYLYLRDLVYKHQLFLAAPMELSRYLEYVHASTSMDMDHILFELQELSFRLEMQTAREGSEKNLVQVEHDLALLIRVADLQSTEMEVKSFGPRMNQFIALCKTLMASNGISSFDEIRVRSLISSSIDYYAMALMRNRPMVDNTLALLGASELKVQGSKLKVKAKKTSHLEPLTLNSGRRPDVAVLVTGGFHTEPLTDLLRQRNVSYIVITPTVDSLTEADHDLYIKRLSGDLLTVGDVLADAEKESTSDYASQSIKTTPVGLAVGGVLTATIAAAALLGAYHVTHIASHGAIGPNDFNNFIHVFHSWSLVPHVSEALAAIQTTFASHPVGGTAITGATMASGIVLPRLRLPAQNAPPPLLAGERALALQDLLFYINEAVEGFNSDEIYPGEVPEFKDAIIKAAESAGFTGHIEGTTLRDLRILARRALKPILIEALGERLGSRHTSFVNTLGKIPTGSIGPAFMRSTTAALATLSDLLSSEDQALVQQILLPFPTDLKSAIVALTPARLTSPSSGGTSPEGAPSVPSSPSIDQKAPPLTGMEAALALVEKYRSVLPNSFIRRQDGDYNDGGFVRSVEEVERGIRAGVIVANPERQALEFAPGKGRNDIPAFEMTDELGRKITVGVETAEDYQSARTYQIIGNTQESGRLYAKIIRTAPNQPGSLFEKDGRIYKVDRVQLEDDAGNQFHFVYRLIPFFADPNAEQKIFGLGGLNPVTQEEANQAEANRRVKTAKSFLNEGKPDFARSFAQQALDLVPDHAVAAYVLAKANEIIQQDQEAAAQRQKKQQYERDLSDAVRKVREESNLPSNTDDYSKILEMLEEQARSVSETSVPEGLSPAIVDEVKARFVEDIESNKKIVQDALRHAAAAAEQSKIDALQKQKEEVIKLQAMRDAIAKDEVARAAHIFDVHGDPGIPEDVIQLVKAGKIDEVVFHGDAFDRGRQNFEVLAKFKELHDLLGDKFVLILGNHDVWMIQALILDDIQALAEWIMNDDAVFREAGFDPLRDQLKQLLKQGDKRGAVRLLQEVLNDDKIKPIREMARWMAVHQQFHFVDERGVLHVHAGIPLDEQGRPKIKLVDLKAADKDLQKLQVGLVNTDRDLKPDEKDTLKGLLERMHDIFWVREEEWVDRLLVDRGGQIQLKNPGDAAKLAQVKERIREALREKGAPEDQLDDLVAQNLPSVLPKFNIPFVKQAPKVDEKRLQAFLDEFEIQGVMFGHDHHAQLNNVDARIFGADLDQKAFMIHDHEGIKLRTRTDSQDELQISKESILARLDQEIARKARAAGVEAVQPEQTPAPIVVAAAPQPTGEQRRINFKKQELLQNGQGLVIRWGKDGLFSVRVRVSTTDPSLVRISAVRIGKQIASNVGTIMKGQSLWVGRDTKSGSYTFQLATEKPANLEESRHITNSNGDIIIETAAGATSNTSVETEALAEMTPEQASQLLARLMQDVATPNWLPEQAPVADEAATGNVGLMQTLDAYMRSLADTQDPNQRILFMRTLKLIAATAMNKSEILSTPGMPKDLLETYQDANGSQLLWRQFFENIDQIQDVIPSERAPDYQTIAETLQRFVNPAMGEETLTLAMTRRVGNLGAFFLRSYYRLTRQKAKANEIGVRHSDTRRIWIQERVAPKFEKWFILLFPKWFVRSHGRIMPKNDSEAEKVRVETLQAERDRVGMHLGETAKQKFNNLLTADLQRFKDFVNDEEHRFLGLILPVIAWAYRHTLPTSLRAILHPKLAKMAANETIEPHLDFNKQHKLDGGALTLGLSGSDSKVPQSRPTVPGTVAVQMMGRQPLARHMTEVFSKEMAADWMARGWTPEHFARDLDAGAKGTYGFLSSLGLENSPDTVVLAKRIFLWRYLLAQYPALVGRRFSVWSIIDATQTVESFMNYEQITEQLEALISAHLRTNPQTRDFSPLISEWANRAAATNTIREQRRLKLRASSVAAKPPVKPSEQKEIRIDDIQNEQELIQRLQEGYRVVAYHGTKRTYSAGQQFQRDANAESEKHSKNHEEVIEQVREKEFSTSPSRITSMYLGPAANESKHYGKVYEVVLTLKDNQSARSLPLRWLDRGQFEYYSGIYEQMALSSSINAEPTARENERLLQAARDYWRSTGSHARSEILVDLERVSVEVMGEYQPSPEEQLKDFVDYTFTDDFENGIYSLRDVPEWQSRLESLREDHDPLLSHFSEAQIGQAVGKRLLEKVSRKQINPTRNYSEWERAYAKWYAEYMAASTLAGVHPDQAVIDSHMGRGNSVQGTGTDDISIAAEGEQAASHADVNNAIDTFRQNKQVKRFPLLELFKSAWLVARAGEWKLGLRLALGLYFIRLYGDKKTAELVAGQTTHAGISTGAIHLARGEYLRLKALGPRAVAGRIAHEAKEISLWRQEAQRHQQSPQSMRTWIKANLPEARNLDRQIHQAGLDLERKISGDANTGTHEITEDPFDINIQAQVETVPVIVTGPEAKGGRPYYARIYSLPDGRKFTVYSYVFEGKEVTIGAAWGVNDYTAIGAAAVLPDGTYNFAFKTDQGYLGVSFNYVGSMRDPLTGGKFLKAFNNPGSSVLIPDSDLPALLSQAATPSISTVDEILEKAFSAVGLNYAFYKTKIADQIGGVTAALKDRNISLATSLANGIAQATLQKNQDRYSVNTDFQPASPTTSIAELTKTISAETVEALIEAGWTQETFASDLAPGKPSTLLPHFKITDSDANKHVVFQYLMARFAALPAAKSPETTNEDQGFQQRIKSPYEVALDKVFSLRNSLGTQSDPDVKRRVDAAYASSQRQAVRIWFETHKYKGSAYDLAGNAESRNAGPSAREFLYRNLDDAFGSRMSLEFDYRKASLRIWNLQMDAKRLGSAAHAELAAELTQMMREIGFGDPMSVSELFPSSHQATTVPGSVNSSRAMNVFGQAFVGFVALMHLDFKGMWTEWQMALDIVFNSDMKSQEDNDIKVGAIKLTLEKLLELRYPLEAKNRPRIIVERMDHPRWYQALTFERFNDPDTGESVLRVRFNPRLKIKTLRWGLIHEMFHELQPASDGWVSMMKEEIVVTRETRKFMDDSSDDVRKAVDISGQAVQQAIVDGIAPTPELLKTQDTIFQALWDRMTHKPKEADVNLVAAQHSFLDAA